MDKIITGFYGKNGAMADPFETEEEAKAEFELYYQEDPEFEGCYVVEIRPGEWVIAY